MTLLWSTKGDQNRRPNRSEKTANAQCMVICKATWAVTARLQITKPEVSNSLVFFPLAPEVSYKK